MRKNGLSILSQRLAARDPKKWRAGLVGIALLFGGVAAFGTVQRPEEPPVAPQKVVEELALSFGAAPAPAATHTDEVFWREERFARGDTFASFLARLGINTRDAAQIVRENGGARLFRIMRPGMSVQAETDIDGALYSLRLVDGQSSVVGLKRSGDGFSEFDEAVALVRSVKVAAGEIQTSLFAATDAAGLPEGVAIQIAEIFSGDIDFHRDLRRGDRFSVVYEMFYHGGQALKAGRVLAAEFINNGNRQRAVWYEAPNGRGNYYTPEGKSLQKAFLRSPLEFSRVTSGFAMRFHPVLQEWRRHKGVDYGAPTGTRIRATADGVVEFAGRQNGYGNTVILRHNGGVTTLYAHMNGFAGGMRKGVRIHQGDTIGYVGATGWATGPHLHYEFRVNGQQRNPLTIAMPSAEPLPAQQLGAFRTQAGAVAAHLDFLSDVQLVALD
jgi:murein DD-endopeptidase MepM/ murein hydrolase activator NlpD